jgi:hypothetical protein
MRSPYEPSFEENVVIAVYASKDGVSVAKAVRSLGTTSRRILDDISQYAQGH